jgi:hypothetical protein
MENRLIWLPGLERSFNRSAMPLNPFNSRLKTYDCKN